jgi:hypothetical protein
MGAVAAGVLHDLACAAASAAIGQAARSDPGGHVAHVRFASLDPAVKAQAQLATLHAVAEPLLDTVDVLPYQHIGTIHGDPVAPMPVANGTASLTSLEGETVAAVLAAADLGSDLPLSSVEIRTLGAATRRQSQVQDAVGGRSTAHLLNAYAAPDPSLDDEARLDAVRAVLDAVAPWRAPVNLVNFVGRANGADAIEQSWTPQQNDQLDAIRERHDPDALFPYARHGRSAADDGNDEVNR